MALKTVGMSPSELHGAAEEGTSVPRIPMVAVGVIQLEGFLVVLADQTGAASQAAAQQAEDDITSLRFSSKIDRR